MDCVGAVFCWNFIQYNAEDGVVLLRVQPATTQPALAKGKINRHSRVGVGVVLSHCGVGALGARANASILNI